MFGLFNEHGPFKVKSDNTLEPRSTTWALTHNMIYIDNPVGTGMSLSLIITISHKTIFMNIYYEYDNIETNRFSGYSFTNSCYATSEKEVANDLYDALTQFFQLFNTLKNNDFYVTGESYAGKYVPAISYKIHTSNKLLLKTGRPRDVINLKVSNCFLCTSVQ